MHYIVKSETLRKIEHDLFQKGLNSLLLMERAGQAVADVVYEYFANRRIVVLAGTGNNGGDGFIIAEELRSRGLKVSVVAVNTSVMKGDAFHAMQLYKGDLYNLSQLSLNENTAIVDCLFGIGLDRAIEGEVATTINAVNASGVDVISVDIPSGIEADTGAVLGTAIKAKATVTFGYRKFGHMLLPGRLHCGEVIVANIGLESTLATTPFPAYENTPDLFLPHYRWPQAYQHKYDRGHSVVVGGQRYKAGASKLAAIAALRTGSGLASIACSEEDIGIYASWALSVMTRPEADWAELMKDARCNTVLVGPGAGVGEKTREKALSALGHAKYVVIDADALTSFAEAPEQLFFAIQSPCILTPHAGEFKKLFPALATKDKVSAAQEAAKLSHAVVVYKGYDTVIAAPDGRICINTHAPAELATAGSGDVLSGICTGLLAQGMDPFFAACAAVWIQSDAATLFGNGLISEDLNALIPQVLRKLRKFVVAP